MRVATLSAVGLIWGVLWVALAIIAGTLIGFIDPADIGPGEEPLVLAPMIGLVGFACGLVFAALVATVEKRQAIFDAPLARICAWGMLVCAALPFIAGKGLPEILVTIPLGALSAITSVASLRRWTVRTAS